jgi:alpha-tubulin suppressor-like RCC1 family protein
MAYWKVRQWSLAAVLVLAAACSSSKEPKKGLSDGCVKDSDCEGSLVCGFGRCHEECATSEDCEDEGRCVQTEDGLLVCQLPEESECEYNSDCPDPLVCAADFECRSECQADRDCVRGQVCANQGVCAEEDEVNEDGDLIGVDDDGPGKGGAAGAGAGGKPEGGSEPTAGFGGEYEGDAGGDAGSRAAGAGGAVDAGGEAGATPPVEDGGAAGEEGEGTAGEAGSAPSGGSGGTAGGTAGSGAVAGDAGAAGTPGSEPEVLVIAPTEGTYNSQGLELYVPSGAVSEATEITVKIVGSPPVALPEGWTAQGDIFEVNPADFEFAADFTISVPHDASGTGSLLLAWLDDPDGEWQELAADVSNNLLIADNAGLGWYVVVSTFDCSQCTASQRCEYDRCYDQCDALTPCSGSLTCCTVNGEGICVDTDTDLNHCGGCGATCAEVANAVGHTCSAGSCGLADCIEPYLDCDGNPANGCEVDPRTDPQHCGQCVLPCGVGAECIDSTCETGLAQIAAGSFSTCVLRENGVVACWGNLSSGAARLSPQVVPGVSDVATLVMDKMTDRGYAVLNSERLSSWATATEWETPLIESITGVLEVGASNALVCVRRTGSLVSCWGTNNTYGQLGNGSFEPSADPVAVSGLNDAVQLGIGQFHACARQDGGQAVCWGRDNVGQLGNDAERVNAETPRTVAAVTDFVDIAVGSVSACGLRVTGEVVCWGSNNYGQLGGFEGNYSTVPTPVAGLTNVASLHAGRVHFCALHTDATVSCWGRNTSGELGDGTTDPRDPPAPQLVPGLTDVVMIAPGAQHTCALRSSGPPLCWGDNLYGQLGDDTGADSLTAVAVADLP